ncbi:DUF4903 family protein [Limibacterium fermenti]|uniref:DUF4903 family protein n=1 Tax=Limibacterium fermenti TaxID=3229863 RepID=UPI000E9E37A4|nr:DUF4903 domain-containing protein [Porphyromonadaceae bacterium]
MNHIKSLIYIAYCLAAIGLFFTSCSSDEKITKEPPAKDLVLKAREFLQEDIVLSTHATMNGVNKTLLPAGCPTKFNFTWPDNNTMKVSLKNFSVGKMPLTVSFRCDVEFIQLNTYEKDTYKGSGWIKFQGNDGETFSEENAGNGTSNTVKGSGITGYFNVDTKQINFIVDYNMMSVRSECFLQTIDKTRIDRFEQEFEQYEKDLAKYKEEHGLS